MSKKVIVSFKLNGTKTDVMVEPRELLIHTLREKCLHTGPHIGCETSHCGACTVDMNGTSVKSCTVLTVQADEAELLTVEGLAKGGELHALQEGFMQERLLYAGHADARLSPVTGKPKPQRGGDPLLDGRQSVPLHRLSEHRESGAVRRRQTAWRSGPDFTSAHGGHVSALRSGET
jgi:hypothetical protein